MRAYGRPGERSIGRRVLDRPVRKREMVALDDIIDADRGVFVAGDRKADGVRAVSLREAVAGAAGIPQAAEGMERGFVGFPWLVRNRGGDTGPGISQRQPGIGRAMALGLR